MVIKLVAVDRKWLEGGTPPLQKPLNSKKWASCGARRKVQRRRKFGMRHRYGKRGCEYRGDRRLW